ncbi:hypothetical protein Tco_1030740 [Tanacetum coccineum]|uniref:Uncharacterized protein n=1 Tax=Tanacetum coccineum TaxID=301880 RepID=A0ABQ5G787_9ASTR
MEEVKGLKMKIETPSGTSPSNSQSSSSKSTKQKTWFGPCNHCGLRNHVSDDFYSKPKCSTCRSTNHLTKEHIEQIAINKTISKLKAQSSMNPLVKKAPMIPKPFKNVNIVDSMTIILITMNTTLDVKYVEILLMNQLTVLRGTPTAGNQGSLTSDPPNPLKSGFTKETNLCKNVYAGLLKEGCMETQKDMAQSIVRESLSPGLLT